MAKIFLSVLNGCRREVGKMDVQKKHKIEHRRKTRLMCYFRLLKQKKHIPHVTTK